jgi:hypothetical protein
MTRACVEENKEIKSTKTIGLTRNT